MFNRVILKRSRNTDGERPFWISYADLMTACMTLFLVVMAVTIVANQKKYEGQMAQEKARLDSIEACSEELKNIAETKFPKKADVEYNKGDDIRINLGSVVNFQSGKHSISSDGSSFLRSYIPSVLNTVKLKQCSAYFRRVIVEGYTDTDGTYMYNLSLSLDRSRQVVCELSKSDNSEKKLTADELIEVRDLFWVGGFSFNSFKKEKSESRRVELKLEFWKPNDKDRNKNFKSIDLSNKEFGEC
jgi:outer membrane protein OmpA-like peptidoglycan-associated protein